MIRFMRFLTILFYYFLFCFAVKLTSYDYNYCSGDVSMIMAYCQQYQGRGGGCRCNIGTGKEKNGGGARSHLPPLISDSHYHMLVLPSQILISRFFSSFIFLRCSIIFHYIYYFVYHLFSLWYVFSNPDGFPLESQLPAATRERQHLHWDWRLLWLILVSYLKFTSVTNQHVFACF